MNGRVDNDRVIGTPCALEDWVAWDALGDDPVSVNVQSIELVWSWLPIG